MIKEKKCKRKKCPYYNEISIKCIYCEWHPDSLWVSNTKEENNNN